MDLQGSLKLLFVELQIHISENAHNNPNIFLYGFDLYGWLPDFLETKNGSQQQKNLKNLLLKQIVKRLKKNDHFFFTLLGHLQD